MSKLYLTYVTYDEEGSHMVPVGDIHCEDLLEGLTRLHDRLPAAVMTCVYRSTGDATDAEIISGFHNAGHHYPVTITG